VLLLALSISPALESLLGASTVELNRGLTLDEVLDGRIAVDFVLVAELLLDSAIDLSDDESRVRVGSSELLPGRSKTLAVTAPWGKELHGKRLLLELSIEILGGKRKDTNLLGLLLLLGLFLLGLLRDNLLGLFGGLLVDAEVLVDVVDVSLNGARDTDVLSLTAVGDELDSRITTDTKALSKILLNSAVDLTNVEQTLGLVSELDPSGSETLAVTAPWGEELDEPETALGLLIEVVLSKDLNLRLLSECANDAGCKKNENNCLHPNNNKYIIND